ncbi:hypothetical protein MSTE_03573 [Mycobacteroides stephanolepidis]|uniref:Uncharacterized protein n=1 Tax=[Mycobacterium] stephanolepidis TaxID=1520670 RepID=A0A1Z4F0V9_9MYCO|nr:hypothetical protein [[Mycobacterium] stephanolepidis]BAX98873.1 hypothetical protein MSTE_03573 [[Mycobacterium] stephanolepidis]
MTTNDQPSPTDPTPTPPSEPESSTGPNQLEWTARGDGHHYNAATRSGGNYSVYFGDAFENPHQWHTVCWREHHGSLTVDRGELYRGDDLNEALAAAQAHHNATLRRLAWEQYMRDNDPPAIDLSFTTQASRDALSGAIDNPHAGAADPRDPATTHSRCRVCDGPTQWGWCRSCQPRRSAGLP